MNRRDSLKRLATTLAAVPLSHIPPFENVEHMNATLDESVLRYLDALRTEPPCRSEIRFERGGARLFVNGREEFPFFAVSSSLLRTAKSYREAGIRFLHPLIGLDAGWTGPGKYDWTQLERYFAKLLEIVPDAFLFPRIHVYPPAWWKESHPEELVNCGLPVPPQEYNVPPQYVERESGFNWALNDPYAPSFASEIWKKETTEMLRHFLRHVEASPLKSRMMGYHVSGMHTAEWHYSGCAWFPDYSAPMQKVAGPVPSVERRIDKDGPLLRNPETDADVINFLTKYHVNTAETVAGFAKVVKEETGRRVICGTFFCYVLENVMIQEAGHLVPDAVLRSPDIDFIATPYTYQRSNVLGNQRWDSDVIDDAGNWLGRARGVGGDGAYRVLSESMRRNRKMFISEIDCSTYVEPTRRSEGGSGSDTVEGTLKILRRDIGQVFATGHAGWLFDFGHLDPPFKANKSWYDDPPMTREIKALMSLGGKERPKLDISPVSEIAAVYEPKSWLATKNWKAEEPWEHHGIVISDFIGHWIVNSQARTIHRIGAPADFVYRFDLTSDDRSRFKLFLMVNTYFLTGDEVQRLRMLFRGSGATVVWVYAPGYIGQHKFEPSQMEELTGFTFKRMDAPGPMMIRCKIEENELKYFREFGVQKPHYPRFAVIPREGEKLRIHGTWSDSEEIAFASREYDGFTSIYVGTGPMPVEVLRWIAGRAGVKLWSSKPDNVRATKDAAMLVASDEGERVLRLPHPMASVEGGAVATEHRLSMQFGEVRLFVKV
jgi:beta-galactosidase